MTHKRWWAIGFCCLFETIRKKNLKFVNLFRPSNWIIINKKNLRLNNLFQMKTDILWTWEKTCMKDWICTERIQQFKISIPFNIFLQPSTLCMQCNFCAITIKFYSPQSSRQAEKKKGSLCINFKFFFSSTWRHPSISMRSILKRKRFWKTQESAGFYNTQKNFFLKLIPRKNLPKCDDLVYNGCRLFRHSKRYPEKWEMTVDLSLAFIASLLEFFLTQNVKKNSQTTLLIYQITFDHKIMQIKL